MHPISLVCLWANVKKYHITSPSIPGRLSHPDPPEGSQRGPRLRNLCVQSSICSPIIFAFFCKRSKIISMLYKEETCVLRQWWSSCCIRAKCYKGQKKSRKYLRHHFEHKIFPNHRWKTMTLHWESQCIWGFKAWAPQLQRRVTRQTTIWLAASTQFLKW